MVTGEGRGGGAARGGGYSQATELLQGVAPPSCWHTNLSCPLARGYSITGAIQCPRKSPQKK